MKGYCVDVRGFSVDKKRLVVSAICRLTGLPFNQGCDASKITNSIVYVVSRGDLPSWWVCSSDSLNNQQNKNLISFNNLMLKAGFNYIEDGMGGFKEKSLSEVEKELEKTDQLIESLGVESGIISDLQSDIECLHSNLIVKHVEIGKLNIKLHETEKELAKSRTSGTIIFACLLVVAVYHLFFGG